MPVPTRRRSKSKKGMNRAHKKLRARNMNRCPQCEKEGKNTPILPHRVCPVCGYYKGRPFVTKVTST
jgi:large subunit ribosomal protein L32